MKKALFSKVAGSLLLSAGLIASGSASADTTLTFDAAGHSTFRMQHDVAGSYEDVFLFSVDGTSNAIGNAIAGFDWNMLSNYGITNVQFFWVDLDTTFNSNGYVSFRANEPLAAGNYGFVVTGATAIAGKGGTYAGNLSVSPVPEPATYAMLGIGVGLLAFTARRKTDNKLG